MQSLPTALLMLGMFLYVTKFITTGQELDITASHFCNVDYRFEDNATTAQIVTVTSEDINYECRVNVRPAQERALLMTIVNADIINLDYLYVDTVVPSNLRFLTFSGIVQGCQLFVELDEVSIHIRSPNATVELQLTDAKSSSDGNASSTQVFNSPPWGQCGWLAEYPERIECGARPAIYYGIEGVEAICSLTCPAKCLCTLHDLQVQYSCDSGEETGAYFLTFPAELTLEFLDFSQSLITYIDPQAFQRFSYVTVLKMKYGILSRLGSGSFSGMEYLVNLDLSYNNIHTVEPGVFKDLTRLQLLNLQNNYITELGDATFEGLLRLRALYFRKNDLQHIGEGAFKDLHKVLLMDLGHNQLKTLPMGLFSNNPLLAFLYLRYNSLEVLQPDAFRGLSGLRELHLHNNSLTTLQSSVFEGATSLTLLTIDANRLTTIQPDLWLHTPSLERLNLSHNHLHDLRGHLFGNLSSLVSLDLQFNELTKIEAASFEDLNITTILYVDDTSACCYVADAQCVARIPAHHFLTCDWLLPNVALKFIMWLLGFSALICNIIVIVRQCGKKRRSKIQSVQRLVIINLAASDFLMGIYLLIITSADAHYQSFFPLFSEQWRGSAACKIASILSVTSSEASLFFVTLISVERSLVVLFPFQQYRIGQRSFAVIVLFMWTVAILFGIIPTLVEDDRFYEVSQVCIGLPLVRQTLYTQDNVTYEQDWRDSNQGVFQINTISGSSSWMHFSIAVFLGLNLVCCLIIFLCYTTIFVTVKKTATHVSRFKESHTEEVQMAIRMAVVVLTDFICWMPIIIMGIMVQANAITLSPTVYAWTATFLLPINSAVNPFLYTLATYREGQKSDWGTKEIRHGKVSESCRDPVTQRELISMLPRPSLSDGNRV